MSNEFEVDQEATNQTNIRATFDARLKPTVST